MTLTIDKLAKTLRTRFTTAAKESGIQRIRGHAQRIRGHAKQY